MNLWRAFALFVIPFLLIGCGPNHADQEIHPKIVQLRVMLEHGVGSSEYEKAVRSTRYDFELHKEDLSKDARTKCDRGLSSAEALIDFSAQAADGEIAEIYPELHHVGVYKSKSEFRDDIKTYKDLTSLDPLTDAKVLSLQERMNELTLELVGARIRKVAVRDLKLAEAATNE